MRIRMLPSAVGGGPLQYLTTFLVNESVAIDAGSLGFWASPSDQSKISHVFLSHSHADHVCSLPMFVTNTLDLRSDTVTVRAPAPVLASLASDMFNDRVWPDFSRMTLRGAPLLRLEEIGDATAVDVDGLRLTPVRVAHPVPTVSYIVDDGTSAVVISTDSAPTEAVWQQAGRLPHLEAIFLGTSFPNEEQELARLAGHLTVSQVADELEKMPAGVDVYAVHIKPGHREKVIAELAALERPHLRIAECDRDYVF